VEGLPSQEGLINRLRADMIALWPQSAGMAVGGRAGQTDLCVSHQVVTADTMA
jgi:hypothetical protein